MGKLEFKYNSAPQRSPDWLATKRGKIGASRLSDWLAVSKAKGKEGTPLKARLDYEKELMFERQFNTSFSMFVNDAMQDGIDYEDYAAKQYGLLNPDVTLEECGCWYNDYMAVSPDRLVTSKSGEDVSLGLIEIKIVRDNTFVDVLMNGVPDKHMKQIQAQLWATKLPWCDYVCLNFNTKKIVIIRVEPDTEFHEYLAEAIKEELVTKPFSLDTVHDIQGELPDWSQGTSGAHTDHSDSNVNTGGW